MTDVLNTPTQAKSKVPADILAGAVTSIQAVEAEIMAAAPVAHADCEAKFADLKALLSRYGIA